MNVENIEGIQDYTIGLYSGRSDSKKHYCRAELMFKGYKIELPRVYYDSLDEAVQGLKDRLVEACKEFELNHK